jgi:hypothetical protein
MQFLSIRVNVLGLDKLNPEALLEATFDISPTLLNTSCPNTNNPLMILDVDAENFLNTARGKSFCHNCE